MPPLPVYLKDRLRIILRASFLITRRNRKPGLAKVTLGVTSLSLFSACSTVETGMWGRNGFERVLTATGEPPPIAYGLMGASCSGPFDAEGAGYAASWSEPSVPRFPDVPPKPTTFVRVAPKLIGMDQPQSTLWMAAQRLSDQLENLGYEHAFYTYKDGFAVAANLEQFGPDGAPIAPPDRWRVKIPRGGPLDFIKNLFVAPVGRYRVIVFVVSERPLSFGKNGESEEVAGTGPAWLPEGAIGPDCEWEAIPTTTRTQCYALVYEYLKVQGAGPKAVFQTGENKTFTAAEHLKKAGFFTTSL